jgi:FkbM family methyltransferase
MLGIGSFIHWLNHIRQLRRIMPTADAIRLTCRRGTAGDIEVFLYPVNRSVVVRGGTSDPASMENVFLWEEYSPPNADYSLAHKVIVDGGANIGMATLYFASRHPDASIISIEPETENFAMLRRNCGHLPNVKLIHAALWSSRGSLGIVNPEGQAWTFSITDRNDHQVLETVSAITLDEIIKTFGPVDLLKLDVEGAERELFLHSGSWIDRVGMIAIELHDRNKPGCAKAMYAAIAHKEFIQENKGENIFLRLEKVHASTTSR